jgi:hypothetical protein
VFSVGLDWIGLDWTRYLRAVVNSFGLYWTVVGLPSLPVGLYCIVFDSVRSLCAVVNWIGVVLIEPLNNRVVPDERLSVGLDWIGLGF